jgi:ELWxxDGT repeat protein
MSRGTCAALGLAIAAPLATFGCGDNLAPLGDAGAQVDARGDAGPNDPQLIADLRPGNGNAGSSFPTFFVRFGDRACFTAFPVGVGPGILGCSDGTKAGTVVLREFDYYPHALVAIGDRLLALAGDDGAFGIYGSDGTTSGTTLVAETPGAIEGSFDGAARFGDSALFLVRDQGTSLWRSDGTPSGTTRLVNFTGNFASEIVTDASRAFFFVGTDLLAERGLWVTDGTAAGTRRVKAIDLGADTLNTDPVIIGPALYYHLGPTLWRFEGASAELVHGFVDGRTFAGARAASDMLFLRVTTPSEKVQELWTSDGTNSGTIRLHQGPIAWLAVLDDTLYFLGGGMLWRSDGTAPGTVVVAPVGQAADLPPSVTDGRLFFASADSAGAEPWRSDGTLAGTALWFDLAPGAPGSRAYGFTAVPGRIVFAADDGPSGVELWSAPAP